MSTKLVLATAAAALAVSACSSMGGDSAMSDGARSQAAMPGDMTPETAMPYVAMAGASDLYEIQSSQLQHQRGQNQQLHAFAQMMIDHHTLTTQATVAAAQAAGMSPPPPMLMPMQQQMIAKLQGLNGAQFDREYATQQKMAHEMALALHENYARAGDTPSLKGSASSAVPIVREHLTQLSGMSM